MKFRYLLVLFSSLVMCSMPLSAKSIDQESLVQLAASAQWLALLHVNQGATIHSRGESYVDDDDFFLAADGNRSSLSELRASIAILGDQGAEERCRFPARTKFLARRLGWSMTGAFKHCEDYLAWTAEVPRARAVLVFPASYLNSPSSMFGHTLLRLDHDKDPDSVWHSWAISFGAIVSESDNSIFYVYKGIAGGYPGEFKTSPYVAQIQEYANLENRDMWEYSLDLSDEQIDVLVDHLWELREINFNYYFFDENCSFRLLEIIDAARPGKGTIEGFRLAEAPVNTVRVLEESGLITAKIYRPSKAMLLSHDINMLSPAQRRLAANLMSDISVLSSDEYLALSEAERHSVAKTAYQALRFRYRKKARTEEVATRSYELLREMNENAPAQSAPVASPAAPEDGHGTQRLWIGGGDEGNNAFGVVGYRFTYHDLIDNGRGFLPGAQIEGLDLKVRYEEKGDLQLESLDIVHIRSHSPRSRFIKPVSWFVQGAVEQAVAGGRERLVRFLEAGPGLSWQAGPLMPYAFIAARLENNSAYTPLVQAGAGAQVGLLGYFSGSQWDLGARGIYFGNDEYRYRYAASGQFNLARQHGLRLEGWRDNWRTDDGWRWTKDHEYGFKLSWLYYID